MQRLCSKLRSLTVIPSQSSSSTFIKPPQLPSLHHHLPRRFLHSSPPNPFTKTLNHHHSFISPNFYPLLFISPSTLQLSSSATFNHVSSLSISVRLRNVLLSAADGIKLFCRHKNKQSSIVSIQTFRPHFLYRHGPQSLEKSGIDYTQSFMQVRHLTLKQRKRKLKSRQPLSPVVSKLKKYKMKSYSSFKGRFRTMNDGQIRRWKEGKRHNAHLKSKIAKRRGRLPALVPAAYAKVMKKLNFCG